MDNELYFIYKTTNLVNGKIYIGQHKQETSIFDGYIGSGKYFKIAVKKYGKSNFIRETLEYCTKDNVDEKEIHWIKTLRATDKTIGYNLTKGGEGVRTGYKSSEETKLKISKALKGNTYRLGKPHTDAMKLKMKERRHSEETKRKLSLSGKGKPKSEEHKRKIRDALTGSIRKPLTEEHKIKISEGCKIRFASEEYKQKIKKPNKGFLGHKLSEESKRKIGDANRGRRCSEETRRKIAEVRSGRIVIHNPLTNDVKFISKLVSIPDGWLRGMGIKGNHLGKRKMVYKTQTIEG